MALERTATGGSSPSASYAATIASRTVADMGSARASADSAKPGGTGIPPAISSPRLALLPPKSAASAERRSASARVCTASGGSARIEDRHLAGCAVHAQPLSGRDAGRCGAGANHGGEAVLARDDRRGGHDPP